MKQFAHHSFRLLALLVCAICASSSRADLLTYEGFNYYPNTLESGNAGTNWTTTWGQFSSNSGRFSTLPAGVLSAVRYRLLPTACFRPEARLTVTS